MKEKIETFLHQALVDGCQMEYSLLPANYILWKLGVSSSLEKVLVTSQLIVHRQLESDL